MKLGNIFFWSKRNKSNSENKKAEEMIQTYIKYLPELRKVMREANAEQDADTNGKLLGQMYDFYEDAMTNTNAQIMTWEGGVTINSSGAVVNSDKRIEATPLAVLEELERVPIPFTCEKLDEKIQMFKDKSTLTNQRYSKAQLEGFTKRLENRKKYKDEVEFYAQFPNTMDENIDKLLDKYKLVMKTTDLFVPSFPQEAVDVMKKYSEVTKRITGEKPVFYVIAEEKDFKKKFKKLDPILLAQSPFGFYWQILGAWDKEMLLLHEL